MAEIVLEINETIVELDFLGPNGEIVLEAAAQAVAAKDIAVAAATEAGLARDALTLAGVIYPTTAAGLAATAEGGFFVVAGTGNAFATLYRETGGAAVAQESYPSLDGLTPYGRVAPVVTGVVASQSAAINAALADAEVTTVILPAGVIWVATQISIPTGKTLRGLGRGVTVVRAMAGFEDSTVNASVIATANLADGCGVYDMTIDAMKAGLGEGLPKRVQGLVMRSRDFTVKRVDVLNCSGYGHWCQGSIATGFWVSGSYEDCRSDNCQIHFEQGDADGVTLIDCRSSDGDGDIANQSCLHPLTGSRNIGYIGCRGESAGVGVEITPSVAAMDNIRFLDCHYRTTTANTCFTVTGGQNDLTNLSIVGSSFVSEQGAGAVFNAAQGAMTQSQFRGIGNAIVANNSDIQATGCAAYAFSDPDGGSAAVAISAPGSQQIRWLGGIIEADGPPGLEIPVAGGVIVSGDTLLIPASTSTLTSFPGAVSAAGNLETDDGIKVKGAAFDNANTQSLELGYDNTNGGYLVAVDRTGGGAVFKPVRILGEFRVFADPGTLLSATIDGAGLNLVTGNTYRINAVQVVGPRGAAVADVSATALAVAVGATPTKAEFDLVVAKANSLVTQLNSALLRLRTHGLIA